MKNRENNPRNSDVNSAILDELSGYTDLGMKSAALKLVRKILAKQLIEPIEFAATINTIGMYGSTADVRKWREMVEAAYAPQSPKTKQAMNGDIFRYYHILKESGSALRFVTAHEMKDASNAIFIMELLLESKRTKEAKLFARRCEKALACVQDRFHASILIEALAVYHASIREWDKAIYLWQNAPLEEPFRQNATSGIVDIHLARALVAAQNGLEALDQLKKHFDPEDALSLPGNDQGMTLDSEKSLLKFKRGIERLLPEKRRRELGLIDTADDKR